MKTYSVQQMGRSELTYSEGGHVMRVDVETGFKRPPTLPITEKELNNLLLIIYEKSINRWLPPFDDEPVTQADRQRILANIVSELRARGEEFVIE